MTYDPDRHPRTVQDALEGPLSFDAYLDQIDARHAAAEHEEALALADQLRDDTLEPGKRAELEADRRRLALWAAARREGWAGV